MDSKEYTRRRHRIFELAKRGHYQEATKEADQIDWAIVQNTKTIEKISLLYLQCRRYEEGLKLLEIIFGRDETDLATLKRICAMTAALGQKEKMLQYYDKFLKLESDKLEKKIMKYRILKAMDIEDTELIKALEAIRAIQYQSKWAYELAEAYARVGREEDSIRECCRITEELEEDSYTQKADDLRRSLGWTEVIPEEEPEEESVKEEPEEEPIEESVKEEEIEEPTVGSEEEAVEELEEEAEKEAEEEFEEWQEELEQETEEQLLNEPGTVEPEIEEQLPDEPEIVEPETEEPQIAEPEAGEPDITEPLEDTGEEEPEEEIELPNLEAGEIHQPDLKIDLETAADGIPGLKEDLKSTGEKRQASDRLQEQLANLSSFGENHGQIRQNENEIQQEIELKLRKI